MMYHHDDRAYDVAASAAATEMRRKLHARIDSAKGPGQEAIRRIFGEAPSDRVCADKAIEVRPNAEAGLEVVYAGQIVEGLHDHALGQVAEHTRVPRAYLRDLAGRGDWARELAGDTLTRILRHSDERHLVRSVAGQTRGFLSTRYRRLDPGALLESFMGACDDVGALAYEAVCTDTKWMVRATLPEVVEPVPNEVLALGIVIHESPYGNGATEVSPWIERMFCTNLAVRETSLRKVHIGGRLQGGVSWGDDTMQADTELLGLQVRDLVRAELGAPAREKLCAAVRDAHERKVDPRAFEEALKKSLAKEEVAGVMETFRSADTQNLPAGDTRWRASNAISWFAHSVTDPERKYELNKLAGSVIGKAG